MLLPSRLAETTLGDVLGAVHRAGLTGELELIEPPSRGAPERLHHVRLREGLIIDIETPPLSEGPSAAASSNGSPTPLSDRLEALYRIKDARLRFHVLLRRRPAVPLDSALTPAVFLAGRPRRRTREPVGTCHYQPDEQARRRAFRELAKAVHPDRFATASATERAEHERRFAALSARYHRL
jgi:hypothetical protein